MGRSYDIVQYPFVEVLCPDGTSLTSSPANYGQSGLKGGNRPDFFVSLTHKRMIDAANEFTLNFTFVPNIASGRGPNWFEQKILQNEGRIKFRYGLYTADQSEWSNYYFGFIESYTCRFDNGSLNYVVAGVSASVIANIDSIKDKDYYHIRKNDSDDGAYTKDTAETTLEKMEKLVNEDSSLKDYYTFDKENSSSNFEISAECPSLSKNPMQFLRDIANYSIKDKEDPDTYFYRIVVDDTVGSDGKGTIRLVRYASNKIAAAYTFDWGSKDCDVISWSPGYDGSVALVFSRNSENAKKVKSYSSDVEENTSASTIDRADPSAVNTELYSFDNSISESVTDLNSFLEASNYIYNAQITVMGLAGKKAENLGLISSNVEVNPLINGQAHHSQGIYMVTSIVDNVKSGGFTTTLELQRKANSSGDATDIYVGG